MGKDGEDPDLNSDFAIKDGQRRRLGVAVLDNPRAVAEPSRRFAL